MGSNIIFSVNNNEEIAILPIVPEGDLSRSQNNQEFETINNGTLNLIGDKGLYTFSITSIFPSQDYHWLKPGSVGDPEFYITFFNKWWNESIPFRVIASKKDGTEWFNLAFLIDDFQHRYRRNGDVAYSLSLSEYPFIGGS